MRARRSATVVSDPDQRKALLAEWVEAMTDGPGVIALRGAFDDTAPVDAVTVAFNAMIAEERAGGVGGGDHFAKPGANDRVWNALEKLCLRDPEAFAAYYGNDIIALVSEAWLGPCYQVTSQLNSVNPGGAAQSAHRDYHLGFQTPAVIERYPVHVHRISPVLTLQGAVAHCDMPLESGPTLYLPYSQTYLPGYLAMGRPEFQAYFTEHHVQLALKKGDAAFFNPALFHAAGNNRSADIRRMANLLQVSSAYGRAMESVDRTRMSAVLYPALQAHAGRWPDHQGGCRECRRGVGGGLFLPDQSRPRPAARRPRAGDPAGALPSGARRQLGAGRLRGSAAQAGIEETDLRRRLAPWYNGSR